VSNVETWVIERSGLESTLGFGDNYEVLFAVSAANVFFKGNDLLTRGRVS
jgi:hypothetical protein